MFFTISKEDFLLDGKKTFLQSGEIHYFRIRPELWDKHLAAAAEAGLTTVSTYVPWAWHEPGEGHFDFDGHSNPARNLKGWMSKCQDHGLTCILKPGPFILAEWRGAGLPDWLLERDQDGMKMRTRDGHAVPGDGVSLFNERYLETVRRWYDQVMPLIRDHECSRGGPVIMMQVCNEIGVFSWLAHQADYGNGVRNHFTDYLKEHFVDLNALNRQWGATYSNWNEIEMPPDGKLPYQSRADRGRDHLWHSFWRRYYGDYLRMLTAMVRERGVTIPLYHNLPGWIYGNGFEFPVNITMYEDLFGERSEIIFGVDHIPEFFSYRNLHDDRIINDITAAMQGEKPRFAAEFQSGSREHHVVTNPREMELFYKASVANGLTGWNFYMFSQGRNPARRGYSGSTFYWFTPLSAEGERGSAFPLVSRMTRLVKASEEIILEARRKAEICVLFYPPHYATELERPETGASGLTFVPSAIRRPAWFDGLLKILQLLNIDYDMADLRQATAESLKKYRQVWAFSTDEMDGADQQTIVDYVRNGGHCVVFPYLPDRDLAQNPCTILRDAAGVYPSGKEVVESPLIDILGHADIKCANPQMVYDIQNTGETEVVATTLSGRVCGFQKILGKGSLFHLGTWMGFDTEGHKPVYEDILARSGAKLRHARSSHEMLIVRERFTENSQAILFAANYYNEEYSGRIHYTHPATGQEINLPLAAETTVWPALHGLLIPVAMPISPGLKLLHTTSDILDIRMNNKSAEIILYGHRDMAGEIAFEEESAGIIREVTLNGIALVRTTVSHFTVFSYEHLHRKEMVMRLGI